MEGGRGGRSLFCFFLCLVIDFLGFLVSFFGGVFVIVLFFWGGGLFERAFYSIWYSEQFFIGLVFWPKRVSLFVIGKRPRSLCEAVFLAIQQ